MGDKIKTLINNKWFHLGVISTIILILIISIVFYSKRYDSNGETNMPFNLSKITVISSSEGNDIEAGDSKWAFSIYQSNDVYMYIEKNDSYSKLETIKSVVIDNIQIEAENSDKIKIYKPDSTDENQIFTYSEENIVESLEYTGDLETDLKNLKISNQGGLIVFRCNYNDIIDYFSDDEEIVHTELLKNAGITSEQLKFKISYNLTIKLEDKEFKTTIKLDLPVGDIVQEGTTSEEITDLSEFIFKR